MPVATVKIGRITIVPLCSSETNMDCLFTTIEKVICSGSRLSSDAVSEPLQVCHISSGSSVKTAANNRYQQRFFTLEQFQVPFYSKITYIIIHIQAHRCKHIHNS
jgi:hypothetical protein